MYRIRFNLSRGVNYKKWKVLNVKTKQVDYYSPDQFSFKLTNTKLCNRAVSAKKIFDGHSKFVCSWIECETVEVVECDNIGGFYMTNIYLDENIMVKINYNPRKQPFWTNNLNDDLDGVKYNLLYLIDNQVFMEYKLDLTIYENFINYLNLFKFTTFQSKGLSEMLNYNFKVPKSKILEHIKKMKGLGLIERKANSGYCQTTCASCYEYGCDAGPQSPINYWEIKK